jgi:predicted FMN-binding regulatory protein PaiB
LNRSAQKSNHIGIVRPPVTRFRHETRAALAQNRAATDPLRALSSLQLTKCKQSQVSASAENLRESS